MFLDYIAIYLYINFSFFKTFIHAAVMYMCIVSPVEVANYV